MTIDSGGGNGMSAFATGADLDIPVIDGDAMGRAFPTMYHGKRAWEPQEDLPVH